MILQTQNVATPGTAANGPGVLFSIDSRIYNDDHSKVPVTIAATEIH